MALKQKNKDTEHFFHTDSTSPHGDTSTPTISTPRPANFLEEPEDSKVTLDPLQEGVVFLPHQAPCGRIHQHRSQSVTEYANYSISHLEAEVNSKHLPKKYRCRFCVYKTSYKSDLNRHLKKHGIALQHCPVCNMPFKTVGNLDNHITQFHPHFVQIMGNVSPSLSVQSLKEAFAPAGSVSSSPEMASSQVGGNEVHLSVADPGRDQQTVQSVRDFPTLSQTLHSPHQLHCHMCPFGSNDAQVLARHILTHPGEEEASRAPQSSQQNPTVPGLLCSVCGLTVPSVGDLRAHVYFCTESAKSYQGKHRKRVWAPDSRRGDPTKSISNGGTEVGDNFGFPQRDTIKLKRALTSQNVSSVYQTSSSPAGQISSGKKKKNSMVLPHIPAAVQMNFTTADQNQTESVYHTASRPSPVADTQNGEESHIPESAVQRSVSRESVENHARTFNETYGPSLSNETYGPSLSNETYGSSLSNETYGPSLSNETNGPSLSNETYGPSLSNEMYGPSLSAHVSRLTVVEQGQAQPPSGNMSQTADSIHHSESRPQERGRNSDLSLQDLQSVGRRQQSAPVSSTERDKHSQKETDQRKNMSSNEKRISTSVDSQTTGYKPSENEDEENSDQCTPKTVLIKEEPQSPTASVDLEESEKTRETCPGTRRSELAKDSPRSDTSERECRLCGQLFRDRAHLIKHVQHIHILATEPNFSSIRIQTNRSGPSQHQKLSTHGTARVSENSCLVPKSQDHPHSNHNISLDKDVSRHYLQTHFFHRRVVSEPPPRGRYAVLVSNFDDFASKPYACSLCFFRTAHLCELSQHVHNHLTGGSPLPASDTAGFQSKMPFLVERGASPFKVDSEDGLSFEPVTTVPDSASSGAINASFENLTGIRPSTEQNKRLQLGTRPTTGQSDRIPSSGEEHQTHSDDMDEQTSVSVTVSNSVATSNSCHYMPATESTSSTLEPRPENHSSHIHKVRLVPATMTAAAMDVHNTSADCSNESKHSCEGCADTLMDTGYKLQSEPVQADTRDSRNTPTGSTGSKRNTLLHDGSENARKILKQSVMSTVSENNTLVTANPSILTGKSKHSLLPWMHRSSKKLTQKKSWLDAPNSRWQYYSSLKTKIRVPCGSGKAKMGHRWNAASPQTYRCEQCKHSFTRKQILVRHVRFVHPAPGSLN